MVKGKALLLKEPFSSDQVGGPWPPLHVTRLVCHRLWPRVASSAGIGLHGCGTWISSVLILSAVRSSCWVSARPRLPKTVELRRPWLTGGCHPHCSVLQCAWRHEQTYICRYAFKSHHSVWENLASPQFSKRDEIEEEVVCLVSLIYSETQWSHSCRLEYEPFTCLAQKKVKHFCS